MKFSVKDLRKIEVEYEPTPPSPPPPAGEEKEPPQPGDFPQPPGEDNPWNEKPDPNERGRDGDGDGVRTPGSKPKLVSKKLESEEDLKKFWETKLEEAKDRHAGDIPGELMRAIEKLLGVKVDWKQELRKMISSLSSKSDYFLPNKRFLSTGVQWGSKKRKEAFESLVIIADTSGSVSQKELEQFVSEAMNIMQSFNPKETYLIWCDTTVYEPVDVIKKGETWNYRKAYGGGGTSFIPPVAWIEENIIKKGKKLGPVIFFTDGEPNTGPNGGWPQQDQYSIRNYVNKFFWIILGEGGVPRKHVKVPFGKRIDLIM
jgi:predicted metal-dependent peptidase